uniref:Uncharacterized protein n=1 Tax=Rhizophora mucronata TaxID=61149 RepID=A0A2P2KAU3_RHIMU
MSKRHGLLNEECYLLSEVGHFFQSQHHHLGSCCRYHD